MTSKYKPQKPSATPKAATPLEEMEGILPDLVPSTLDETYKPPSQLEIPQKAVRRFSREGYDLQWVRIYIDNGSLDINNIRKKEADKYVFLTKEEVPEMTGSVLGNHFKEEVEKHKDLIVVGDLALAKVPLAHIDAKRRHYESLTKDRNRAIISDLRNNDLRGEFRTTRDLPRSREVDFGD